METKTSCNSAQIVGGEHESKLFSDELEVGCWVFGHFCPDPIAQLEPFDLAIPRQDITDLDSGDRLTRQPTIDDHGPSIAHVRDHLSCHFTADSIKAGSWLLCFANLLHLHGEILFISCAEYVV